MRELVRIFNNGCSPPSRPYNVLEMLSFVAEVFVSLASWMSLLKCRHRAGMIIEEEMRYFAEITELLISDF